MLEELSVDLAVEKMSKKNIFIHPRDVSVDFTEEGIHEPAWSKRTLECYSECADQSNNY
jgi:hypothetical protein